MRPSSSNGRLPSPLPFGSNDPRTASAKRTKYLRRIFHFHQMDFEFAKWQMIYLLCSPQKVYRNFQYRKQTKDQFARDDPAFLVLLSLWLCASTIGFALYMGMSFPLSYFTFLLWVVFIDCIGVGLVIATLFWFVSNKYLRKPTCVDQDVEWGYAFDVHLNAFFPVLVILHVLQLFIAPLLHSLLPTFLGLMLGNLLWAIAFGYYIYITFLGYAALPILKNTQIILYPSLLVVLWYIVLLICNWNMWDSLLYFYKNRVFG